MVIYMVILFYNVVYTWLYCSIMRYTVLYYSLYTVILYYNAVYTWLCCSVMMYII